MSCVVLCCQRGKSVNSPLIFHWLEVRARGQTAERKGRLVGRAAAVGGKVDEWEVGCWEEEEAERERKSMIRQAEGAGDEQIRRGSTGSKKEVEKGTRGGRAGGSSPKDSKRKQTSEAFYPRTQRGEERKGKQRKGKESRGKERREKESKGKERSGEVRRGEKKKGVVRRGKERRRKESHVLC